MLLRPLDETAQSHVIQCPSCPQGAIAVPAFPPCKLSHDFCLSGDANPSFCVILEVVKFRNVLALSIQITSSIFHQVHILCDAHVKPN